MVPIEVGFQIPRHARKPQFYSGLIEILLQSLHNPRRRVIQVRHRLCVHNHPLHGGGYRLHHLRNFLNKAAGIGIKKLGAKPVEHQARLE